ncbi:MAG: hypothetical protein ACRCX7_11340 [Cetobacterium sp.]|uniref:hypothetical protein n=1 Tax=Cetobacterium sp. TaxID=2071632 RepID=UPI003F3A519B
MKNDLIGALKLNKNSEIKIDYEGLKNYLNYEDIFYDEHLIPLLEEVGATHRFEGKYIILKINNDK